MISWLDTEDDFPPVATALREPNGLLCAGADLRPTRILNAYGQGIFPWFSPGQPILWWSPDPRMVLYPDEFRISRSLRRTLRRSQFRVSFDTCFDQVIDACASIARNGQNGTWITDAMREAYGDLHRRGFSHSVETWLDETLVGGLYGIAIGKVFFGESMFARATDASKVAFAHLVQHLRRHDFGLIDCQMRTSHLASLGAREIPRDDFCDAIRRLTALTVAGCGIGRWSNQPLDIPW